LRRSILKCRYLADGSQPPRSLGNRALPGVRALPDLRPRGARPGPGRRRPAGPPALLLPPRPRLDRDRTPLERPRARRSALARGRRVSPATLGRLRPADARACAGTGGTQARPDGGARTAERAAARLRRRRRVPVVEPRAPRAAGARDVGRARLDRAPQARADAPGPVDRGRGPSRPALVRRGPGDSRVGRAPLAAHEDPVGRDARQAPLAPLVPRCAV